ncbi:hypothetical protein [Pseudomaricurvus sp.]|uniref:hypothetical protein n=1 Tax=Pseudomaricurvus sp. TaxID=2004510 RepID=UPI003F6B872F
MIPFFSLSRFASLFRNHYTLSLGAFILTLSACTQYQMTLNETVVHTPPGLLTDFDTEDPRLKSCLDQIIKDGNFTSFEQVTQLICSHAGLTSLKGIEVFQGLKQINLENNKLTSLKPLQYLSKIEVLKVNDNLLTQVSELLNLPRLKEVQLENNPKLACDDLLQLKQISSANLHLPKQCQ